MLQSFQELLQAEYSDWKFLLPLILSGAATLVELLPRLILAHNRESSLIARPIAIFGPDVAPNRRRVDPSNLIGQTNHEGSVMGELTVPEQYDELDGETVVGARDSPRISTHRRISRAKSLVYPKQIKRAMTKSKSLSSLDTRYHSDLEEIKRKPKGMRSETIQTISFAINLVGFIVWSLSPVMSYGGQPIGVSASILPD